MPSTSTAVGALALPMAAASGADADDPVVVGLLDYIGWTLKDALDTRLAQWSTFLPDDACPTANRFDWNPLEPQGHQVKLPIPALWAWWDGRDQQREHTIVYRKRTRQIRAMYLFPELPARVELQRRAGLLNAASSALHRAAAWRAHPSYSYGSDPDGKPLYSSLADLGLLSIELLGCEQIRFGLDDGTPRIPAPETRQSGRDWPGLIAIYNIEEVIGPRTLVDPDDLNRDHTVTIYGSDGESDDTVEILQGIVGAPDGSEDL